MLVEPRADPRRGGRARTLRDDRHGGPRVRRRDARGVRARAHERYPRHGRRDPVVPAADARRSVRAAGGLPRPAGEGRVPGAARRSCSAASATSTRATAAVRDAVRRGAIAIDVATHDPATDRRACASASTPPRTGGRGWSSRCCTVCAGTCRRSSPARGIPSACTSRTAPSGTRTSRDGWRSDPRTCGSSCRTW